MSNTIGRSFPSSGANPAESHRAREANRGERIDDDAREIRFKGGGPRPEGGPERAPFGGGDDRPEFFRGGGPRPVQDAPRHSVEPPPHGVERFGGALVDYESRETVSLEVKTDDGDTVSISFEALNRFQAGVYEASADGDSASAQTVSAESSIQVAIKVEGNLDEEETSQIAELLQRLVTTARSDEPAAIQTRGLESLDGFQFAYNAYQRAGLATLNARFA